MNITNLNFGTAGIPHSTPERNTIEGIKHVKHLGLNAMELEFVHSVHVNPTTAPLIKKIATDNNILISSHSPYYLNLNAAEPEKLKRSINLLAHSAIMTAQCGGLSTAFHPAFYLKKTPQETYITVKKALQEVIAIVKAAGQKIWIRPELTGKPTQFGNVQEIIRLSQELDLVLPCIDYAHYHARTGGKGNNTLEAFQNLLNEL
ncbi:MAG: TIM barrel protein, partial [Nanoarchaeota archaeon]|nr:TIM barrel protein [Nanoarchaeota archaeon]